MTNSEEILFCNESSTVIAAQLVQLHGCEVAARAARHQVRTYAFGHNDSDGRVIAFWANVLTRVAELSAAEQEISPMRIAALETLVRRSAPQVGPVILPMERNNTAAAIINDHERAG